MRDFYVTRGQNPGPANSRGVGRLPNSSEKTYHLRGSAVVGTRQVAIVCRGREPINRDLRMLIGGGSPRSFNALSRADHSRISNKTRRGPRDSDGTSIRRTIDIVHGERHRHLPAYVCLITLLAAVSHPSWAADIPGQQTSMAAVWQQADLGGLRAALAKMGVQVTFTYYGEALGNPSGGVRQGLIYEGRLGTIVDADLDKLLGWSGASRGWARKEMFPVHW